MFSTPLILAAIHPETGELLHHNGYVTRAVSQTLPPGLLGCALPELASPEPPASPWPGDLRPEEIRAMQLWGFLNDLAHD